MDSFMGSLNFNGLPPSPGVGSAQHSPTDSYDGNSSSAWSLVMVSSVVWRLRRLWRMQSLLRLKCLTQSALRGWLSTKKLILACIRLLPFHSCLPSCLGIGVTVYAYCLQECTSYSGKRNSPVRCDNYDICII